ncbi:MAG: glutamate--cysteine ligase, partial [Halobacteriovoraceae bacterium]|nr:glutamate--cysteine ligase [Halobacteriovoraceae bacterium]
SFLTGKSHQLKKFSNRTLYTEEGTSLRMGGLGYTSSAQEQIKISYNEIDQYISALEKARLETYPPYEKIDEKKDNTRSQLNSNIIQIDNEFYSTIRPKNIAYSSESALKAIHERGVQYIEVRLLDVDPFTPLGISSETIHFMHLFLLWCLAKDSAPLDAGDCDESTYNFDQTVLRGRAKNLELKKEGKSILLADYLSDILAQIDLFAGAIKKVEPFYDIALDKQLRKLKDQDALPSQKLLNEVAGKSFIDYHLDLSRGYVDSYQITPEQKILFNKYTEETLNEQMRIEAEDNIDFDTFLKQYFDSIRINDLKV